MTRIFVGNLPDTATESDLFRLFSRYGHVSAVQIKTDRETQRRRGFAFVRMPCMEDADEAIVRLSETSMNGRQLTVNEAQQRGGSAGGNSTPGHALGHERREAMSAFEALFKN